MSKLSYKDGFDFDIYIYDICEMIKPESCEDLKALAEDLHERVEGCIQDFIYDSDKLDINDYTSSY